MEVRYSCHPDDCKNYDTAELRKHFLVERLFAADEIHAVYSHYDRVVAFGIQPQRQTLALSEAIEQKAFGTDFFLERRELGLVNLGGPARVMTVDHEYALAGLDGLYLGRGERDLRFVSEDAANPAFLYALSAPAHHRFPSRVIRQDEARKVALGSQEMANARVINQYLHPDVLPTCQLCMGITHLKPGSVWNTMPPHTHERRMEVYLYFNLQPEQVVFHFMGRPNETRHLVMQEKQLVLSPSWSIHAGCGTQSYSFVWGMLGENQTFDDMDFVALEAMQ